MCLEASSVLKVVKKGKPCQSGEETMIERPELLSSEQKTTETQSWQPGVSVGEAPLALMGHFTLSLWMQLMSCCTVCAVDTSLT